jgi:hypothetical protein
LRQACAKCSKDDLLPTTLARLLFASGRAQEGRRLAQTVLARIKNPEKKERARKAMFDEPLRLGRPPNYVFLQRDVSGTISRLHREAERPYGFVQSSSGDQYYFKFQPNSDLEQGSPVWFDIVEFPNMREHRYKAKSVEPLK